MDYVTIQGSDLAFWSLLLCISPDFPCGSAGKESTCNAGDLGSIPGLSPGEGKGYPLQYSGLKNSMEYLVHEVEKSQTQLSDFFLKGFANGSVGKEFTCNAGEPSSILGLGRSPGEGNGYSLQYSCLETFRDRVAFGLQSMGSQESD